LFGVGAVSGLATIYAGPWAGGAIAGFGNSTINQGFTNGWSNINWGQATMGGLTGSITSYLGGQLANKLTPYISDFTSKLGGPLIQDMLTNSVVSGATGFTLTTSAVLINGGSFKEAISAGWESTKTGLVTGAVSGFVSGLQRARADNVNPITGKSNEKGNYSVYEGTDPNTGEVKYVGITERDPQVRFNEHADSGTPRADLEYKTKTSGLTKTQARIMEQRLINKYGMMKNGGSLYNKINSIAPRYWKGYGIK
jgi:hypothetical protein